MSENIPRMIHAAAWDMEGLLYILYCSNKATEV